MMIDDGTMIDYGPKLCLHGVSVGSMAVFPDSFLSVYFLAYRACGKNRAQRVFENLPHFFECRRKIKSWQCFQLWPSLLRWLRAPIDVSFSILITFFLLDLLSTRGKKTDPPHPSTKRGIERSEVELTRKRDLVTLFLQQGFIDSWLVRSFIHSHWQYCIDPRLPQLQSKFTVPMPLRFGF